jgi:uncharacterized protein (DUF1800 family)
MRGVHVEKVQKLWARGGHARWANTAVAAALCAALAGCGSSGDNADGNGGNGNPPPANEPLPKAESARFLTQATFGPNEAEINALSASGYTTWLEAQFARPQVLHRNTLNQVAADLAAAGDTIRDTNFYDSWWSQAIAGEDQFRQRAAFALSQIFVISFADATLRNQPRGVASYYDMLATNAFGNFRELLQSVALHPMMGVYLSHLKNQKEDPSTGRVPDLNFAREITQLFTIGQYKLNADGGNVLGSDGKLALAYSAADLSGLSQVFTGWSWYAGTELADRTSRRFLGQDANLERDWRPMQSYNEYAANTSYHSVSAKNFFGVTIPPQTKPDTEGDLTIALDTLFNNPNVGPFIGRQLIQRLVTSNPSPAYVGRVAAAFNDNGKGVRGDMKAVWRAVLLDAEARSAGNTTSYGKVREPLVRLANFMRAFNVKSASGKYTGIGNTDDPATRLNQTPMLSPSVFNFFRPGYVPTSKAITDAGLVVPELQITHDVSVAGYMNYIRGWITVNATRDLRQDYTAELALADTPSALLDRMNLLLFSGQMSDALRTQITAAVASRTIPAPVLPTPTPPASGGSAPAATPTNQAAIDAAKLDRVYLAVYLSMSSPDYLIQK